MKYALLTEIQKETNEVEWWKGQTNSTESLQIFDSFEEAKTEMRKAVKRITKNCEFFPLINGKYEPIEEYACDVYDDDSAKDIKKLGGILCNTIKKADYFCEDTDLNIIDTDVGDWYYEFAGNKDLILVNYYGKNLKMNIHNMTDSEKPYYFKYSEFDDDGSVINSIDVRLYSDAKKKKPRTVKEKKTKTVKKEKANNETVTEKKDYETETFGRYIQKENGTPEPIEWLVLEKEGDKALVISKYALDCKKYNKTFKSVTWETCTLHNWLNGMFFYGAFNTEEQKNIISPAFIADPNQHYDLSSGNNSNDKVFLLNIEEANKYFVSDEDRKCVPTDYALAKGAEKIKLSSTDGGNTRWWVKSNEKFLKDGKETCTWWLRLPGGDSKDAAIDGHGAYVDSCGSIHDFGRPVNAKDIAVRPALWIKLS